MKKILLSLAALFATLMMHAQTCKVSATENNGREIQISVNLDSLKGRTLVTTINHNDNNVILNMAFDGENHESSAVVVPREDSSETAETICETESTVEESESSVAQEEIAQENSETGAQSVGNSPFGGVLDALGISSVTSVISGFIGKNGEQYLEYKAQELLKELTEVDSTKFIPQYPKRKWKWLNKTISYSTLEASGILGKDYGGDDGEGAEKINEATYGSDLAANYNIGGNLKFSQVFVPGRYRSDGSFVPNHLNFAWSVGGMLAFGNEKDYGWSTDIMAKIGLQAGNGITLGMDGLIGAGSTPYRIYSSDGIDYRVITHNQWCFKYGLQAWISMNYGSNTYTSLFARLIQSAEPSSIRNHPTAKGWMNTYVDFDDASWRVGFAVGYKFGYNADTRSKRLQATISTGYNLCNSRGSEIFCDLEKVNTISPTLDFLYGVGYGRTLDDEHLNNLTAGAGWLFKSRPEQKISYLVKFYAGAGEYLVEKHCVSADRGFDLSYDNIRQVALIGGVKLGAAYKFGCSTLSVCIRGGYHYAFDTEYDGFDEAESSKLRGIDLTPMIGYSITF